jgi:hypothetical protein
MGNSGILPEEYASPSNPVKKIEREKTWETLLVTPRLAGDITALKASWN